MEQNKSGNWQEKNLHICLALIARMGVNMNAPTAPINFSDIIKKADRMVRLLKEHEEKLRTNCKESTPKVAK